MNLRVNRDIRTPKVRVVTEDGEQLGVLTIQEALAKAHEMGLDLVEIAPNAAPPVCKLIDYGKFRYQQTKREKISKKATHQSKLKEIKFKPNIDKHDLDVKVSHAKEFIEKGHKVRFTCMFRGREIVFVENGRQIFDRILEQLKDVAVAESPAKMFGKTLTMTMAPVKK